MEFDCPICGADIEILVRYHSEEPFIDGRTYAVICFTCASIPKTWGYENGEVVVYKYKNPERLCSVEDMMEDGWERCEALRSLKAVKKLLKKPKFVLVPENGVHVFEQLFLGDGKLYELTV